MPNLAIKRVLTLPGTPSPSAMYIAKSGVAPYVDLYFTSSDGASVRRVPTIVDIQNLIAANVPAIATSAYKLENARNINGIAFDGTSDITINAVDATPRIAVSEKGAANGVATLNSSGQIPSAQLPSFVDDVLEYATEADFPPVGESGKIYIQTTNNITYRWTGSTYVLIPTGVGLADAALKLNTARSITATGDADWTVSFDGSGDVSAVLTLKNTGVTPGTYGMITLNAKGLATSARALLATDIPSLDQTVVTASNTVYLQDAEW